MATAASPDEKHSFDLNLQHGHKDLVQAVAFNTYGDRCATGSVDGKIRIFNRHRDGSWHICDTWTAHGGEVLELQWLPATVYPNLLASLGIEGWFRLWAEDPSAPPGRRFSAGAARSAAASRAAMGTRTTGRAPYRSFSVRHVDDGATRHTFTALIATDGHVSVFENDQPENITDFTPVDDFDTCPRPSRGEELSFRVRFDPNPEPCYTALRAGVPSDALGLVVAAMDSVKVYRTRDVLKTSYGVQSTRREFYLAVDIIGHRGLVRDVAWAPGNIRGFDTIATACQDGYARVFRIDTPYSESDGLSWSATTLIKPDTGAAAREEPAVEEASNGGDKSSQPSTLSASLAKSGSATERAMTGQPGQVEHVFREVSRLESHRTPVWRVGFDDDGQVLGTTGDDGKLLCYRQVPDGSWSKSSEIATMKTRMAVP